MRQPWTGSLPSATLSSFRPSLSLPQWTTSPRGAGPGTERKLWKHSTLRYNLLALMVFFHHRYEGFYFPRYDLNRIFYWSLHPSAPSEFFAPPGLTTAGIWELSLVLKDTNLDILLPPLLSFLKIVPFVSSPSCDDFLWSFSIQSVVRWVVLSHCLVLAPFAWNLTEAATKP